MKELEKTKSISIAATIIYFSCFNRSFIIIKDQNICIYLITAKTLEKITTENLFVSLEELKNADYVLIDVRKQYEFQKGHLENAINIYTPEILDDENIGIFKELQNKNKTVVLYGKNPERSYCSIYDFISIRYTNLKILPIENSYYQNKLITKTVEVEKYETDIKGFIAESVKKTAEAAANS